MAEYQAPMAEKLRKSVGNVTYYIMHGKTFAIVGYILSEDPTYITNFNNARTLIRKLDRDELLQELVKQYLRD